MNEITHRLPTSGNKQPLRKQWKVAVSRFGHTTQKLNNRIVEGNFREILAKAKKLLSQHPQTVFERDQREDSSHSTYTMHSFLSPSFYLNLDCCPDFNYCIKYAFCNCPYEGELRKLLNCYLLQGKAKEVELKPTFQAFYNDVPSFQHKKYVFVLGGK